MNAKRRAILAATGSLTAALALPVLAQSVGVCRCYLTASTDGRSINLQGFMGASLPVWNYQTQQFVDYRLIRQGAIRDVFGTVLVDGRTGLLADSVPYYVYALLDASNAVQFNFVPVAVRRYDWNDQGVMFYRDAAGRVGALVGMVFPKNGSISVVASGPDACIRISSSPFNATPPQRLPVNSNARGVMVTSGQPQELDGGVGIDALSWAWSPPVSTFFGRVAATATSVPTIFLRPFAYSYRAKVKSYGATMIWNTSFPGQNIPIGGHGVARAFDDDAIRFGFEAWVSGGAALVSIEHVVNGIV